MSEFSREPPPLVALHEDALPGIQKYRTSMADVRRGVQALFESIVPDIQYQVRRAAHADDSLDITQRNRVQREVGDLVETMFVGPGQGRRSPFWSDGVTARSDYGQFLNEMYVRVVVEAAWQTREWMRRTLPDDVFAFLARQQFPRTRFETEEQDNPYGRRDGESDAAFLGRMDDLRVFRPNPLMELDPNRQWVPMHRWNAPGEVKGYRLSDRVWDSSQRTRAKIDKLIAEAFASGEGALSLSRKLERFLLPSRANLRTNKPYGINASYDAMRLARTEIARAANHAAYITSYLNPYVDRVDVSRSPNGDPTCTICPSHATLGISGERLRAPYSIHSAVLPIYHPHCLCHVRPVATDSIETVTTRLRAVVQDKRRNLLRAAVSAAAIEAFTRALLDESLGSLAMQFLTQMRLPGF